MPFRDERCAKHEDALVVGACLGCGDHGCVACVVPVGTTWLCRRCVASETGSIPLPVLTASRPSWSAWAESLRTYLGTPISWRWVFARNNEHAALGLLVLHAVVASLLFATFAYFGPSSEGELWTFGAIPVLWVALNITLARAIAAVLKSSRVEAALGLAYAQPVVLLLGAPAVLFGEAFELPAFALGVAAFGVLGYQAARPARVGGVIVACVLGLVVGAPFLFVAAVAVGID